jgi:hypothetical protein
MLALTHHAIVQFAARRANVITKMQLFEAYALLGDDIVIAHKAVAEEYLKVMAEIGVEINISKSLISVNGSTLEFAKRTFVRGIDCSAVPIKELHAGLKGLANALELGRKYSISPASFLKVFGAKYKTLGSIQKPFFTQGKK